MKLDLRDDIASITEEILHRIRNYSPATNESPGDRGTPVQQIVAGYQFDQAA